MPATDAPPPRSSWPLPREVELVPLPYYSDNMDLIRRLPFLLTRSLPLLLRSIHDSNIVGGVAPSVFGLVMVTLGILRGRRVFMYARGKTLATLRHELAASHSARRLFIMGTFLPLRLLARLLTLSGVPMFTMGETLARDFPGPHVYGLSNYGRPEVIGEGSPPPITATDLRKIAFVGRLSREKGADVLLHALHILKSKDESFELTIAGDGPEREALVRLAGELGIAASVRFLGHVADASQLRDVFLSAGILVVPSRTEGVPMAILEGMTLGRAIVASRAGGIPSVITDGKQGLLVAPDDPKVLAEALTRVAADPGLATSLAAQARTTGLRMSAQAQADVILSGLGQ